MKAIKPIETSFAGFRFRSRMEARWAVFMEHLGVPYLYEPEGFVSDGLAYLPDFYLPQQDAYMEIKSPMAPSSDYDKIEMLVLGTGKNTYVFCYPPTIPDQCGTCAHYDMEGARCYSCFLDENGVAVVGMDIHHIWCQCPHCGRCEIQFDGRADRINCKCSKSWHGDKGYNAHSVALLAAYAASRSARFDHSEKRNGGSWNA